MVYSWHRLKTFLWLCVMARKICPTQSGVGSTRMSCVEMRNSLFSSKVPGLNGSRHTMLSGDRSNVFPGRMALFFIRYCAKTCIPGGELLVLVMMGVLIGVSMELGRLLR